MCYQSTLRYLLVLLTSAKQIQSLEFFSPLHQADLPQLHRSWCLPHLQMQRVPSVPLTGLRCALGCPLEDRSCPLESFRVCARLMISHSSE